MFKKNKEFSKLIIIEAFSLIFSTLAVIGTKIDIESRKFSEFRATDILRLVLFFVICSICINGVLYLIENRKILSKIFDQQNYSRKKIIIFMLGIAAVYLLYLVVYAPGIVAGDSLSSIRQIREGFLENHHPVFYTCFIGLCLKVGEFIKDSNTGILLYCFFQIAVCSWTYASFLMWLKKKGVRKLIIILVFLYFVLYPVFAIYSITLWKDPMFSCALLWMIMMLYDFCQSQEYIAWKKLLMFGLTGILIGLLRNNGIYIFIFVFAGMICGLKKNRKRIMAVIVPSILILYCITGPFYENILHAKPRFVESVGIPLQQMARVVAEDGEMNKEDEEFLFSLLPEEKWEEYYTPFLVDPIKWAPEFNTKYLNSHKKQFLKTWVSLLEKNLDIYVEQYFMGTTGFWRIGAERTNEFVKLEVDENPYGIYEDSPLGEKLSEEIKDKIETALDKLPMGVYIWLMFFDLLYCVVKRKYKYVTMLLPMLGNWGTLMIATPTAFGLRYIWINVIALPLMLLIPFILARNDQKQSNRSGRKIPEKGEKTIEQ